MFNRNRLAAAVSAAFGAGLVAVTPTAALAQQTLERVEITGSSLLRVDAETALPVTIIRAEELVKQGVTTAEQAVGRIAASQSTLGISQGIGATTGGQAEASLRGLGGNKTLVLLNGRRVVNHAYDSGSVDLNSIPLAAIDRIEVLRDGASAIYGTDAIGGVINFITRRDFTGVDVGAEYQKPQEDGGTTKRASLAGGFGSLQQNRFNVMGVVDLRKQDVVEAPQRRFSASGVVPERGQFRTSGTSFPGDVNGFEPSLPNCNPPSSIPNAAGTACRYDFVRDIDIVPENEQLSLLGRGSIQLAPGTILGIEYLYARNQTVNKVAPTPVSMIIPRSHPNYPPGAPDNEPGGGVNVVNWRTVPAGKRTNENETVAQRGVIDIQGSLGAGWDYKAGIYKGKNESEDTFTNGYINYDAVQNGVLAGVINPFGPQTPAGEAALQAAKILAPVLKAEGDVTAVDARVNKDLAQLAAGPLAMAVGAEWRKEKFTFDLQPIALQAASSGLELAQDTQGDRKVYAAFAEFGIPIARGLEATVAGRFDRYSDFGSTFNPKVALRYQPTRQFLVRASANTGFRAPTLYDIYQPQQFTFTANAYNDPVLCPNGTAVPPASPGVVCDQQVVQRFGGPVGYGRSVDSLDPEKSKTATFGVVFEPVRSATIGIDLWWINVRDQINQLPEQAIFDNPSKYASRIVRCSQASPAERAAIDVCLNFPTYDPIAYIDTPTENLGKISTSGIDVTLGYRFPTGPYGAFAVSLEGTYITKYKYQRERGGAYVDNVGDFIDAGPIFRWSHNLQVNWSAGEWAVNVANRYKSGYYDQDPSLKVKQYSLVDVSVTWTPVKYLTLAAGVKNLFDTEPPYSNQAVTFQSNYDPRFTDPLGRTFTFRVNAKF
jgi:iron complex outermembrane receptor protein